MKADATLVNMAYHMGMANVPKDLSKVHERIADSYSDAMKSIGNSRAAIVNSLAALGTKIVEKAVEDKKGKVAVDEYGLGSESYDTKPGEEAVAKTEAQSIIDELFPKDSDKDGIPDYVDSTPFGEDQ